MLTNVLNQVLIVQADLEVRQFLHDAIKDMGAKTILHASRTAEGAATRQGRALDLILMDISDQDPMSDLAAAVGMQKTGGVPVVFLTSKPINGEMTKVAESCSCSFVRKPVLAADLEHAIALAVGTFQRLTTQAQNHIAEAAALQRLLLKHQEEQGERDAVRGHLASIVESSSDGIATVSNDGQFQSWNSGAARIFGYSAAEMIGQHFLKLVPQASWIEAETLVAQATSGQAVTSFTTVRVAKDVAGFPST